MRLESLDVLETWIQGNLVVKSPTDDILVGHWPGKQGLSLESGGDWNKQTTPVAPVWTAA